MLFCLRALRPGLMWKDRPLVDRLLVDQHRTGRDGPAQPAADRTDAGLGLR